MLGLIALAVLFIFWKIMENTTPDGRWRRFCSRWADALPVRENLYVVESGDSLVLPLPLFNSDRLKAQKIAGYQCDEFKSLSQEGLSDKNKVQWQLFKVRCDSLATSAYEAIDPGQYCVDALLRHFLDDRGNIRHMALMVALVEKLPEYCLQLRDRWGHVLPAGIPRGEACTEAALDQLAAIKTAAEKLPAGYKARFDAAEPAARMALKDHLALVRSGVLK